MSKVYHAIQQLYLFNPSIEHVTSDCPCAGKRCSICKTTRCRQQFSRSSSAPDNLQYTCQICKKVYNEVHREEINAKSRTYHHAHKKERSKYSKVYREVNKEKLKSYRQTHREQRREAGRRFRIAHREEWKAYFKAYHVSEKARAFRRSEAYKERQHQLKLANLERYQGYDKAAVAKRRARKRQVGGSFTGEQWRELKAQYDHTCLCCGKREPEIKLAADHVIPLVKGGKNIIGNIQPLCISCNSHKSTKETDYRKTTLDKLLKA